MCLRLWVLYIHYTLVVRSTYHVVNRQIVLNKPARYKLFENIFLNQVVILRALSHSSVRSTNIWTFVRAKFPSFHYYYYYNIHRNCYCRRYFLRLPVLLLYTHFYTRKLYFCCYLIHIHLVVYSNTIFITNFKQQQR